MRILLEEEKIEDTIKRIREASFTVLDFINLFKTLHPQDWDQLVKRFGTFGEKRRYTVTTYLSNRLDVYSQKANSLLVPFVRWKQGKFQDYRRTTDEERKSFGSPWIAVFKKKKMPRREA
nr:hypothetical protein [Candidatus Njordarchaeum guaymaensis]